MQTNQQCNNLYVNKIQIAVILNSIGFLGTSNSDCLFNSNGISVLGLNLKLYLDNSFANPSFMTIMAYRKPAKQRLIIYCDKFGEKKKIKLMLQNEITILSIKSIN